jgi:2'-hydroxyisoflavone reductase
VRVLVIGGTVFLGWALVEAALDRGDEVTVFHRGRHGRGLHRTPRRCSATV